MSRRPWIGFLLLTASSVPSGQALADSIWDRRDPRYAYLFIDNRARRVGDLVTVTVNESTDATNTEQRKMQKDTAASGKFNFAGSTGASNAGKSAAASVTADNSSDRSFQGSAQYQSNRQLLDGLTMTVVDILPNGNLVIEGSRDRIVSNEHRLMRISGVIRPNDVDISNTIGSQFIAEFKVRYEGGGVESRFTNQGWVGRMTNKLWPY